MRPPRLQVSNPAQACFQPETSNCDGDVGTGAVSVEPGPCLGRQLAPARAPAHPVPRVRAVTEGALTALRGPTNYFPPCTLTGAILAVLVT
jgi:hypothetical protein